MSPTGSTGWRLGPEPRSGRDAFIIVTELILLYLRDFFFFVLLSLFIRGRGRRDKKKKKKV